MREYKVAILGATGAVGQEMMKILAERDFPVAELHLLASERSVGKEVTWKGRTLTVELAEVETSVIRLAQAIQKTQKRANALGNVQIPQMQKTIKSIDEVLGGREREEFSRLKVIKAQKEKQAEEA